MDNGTKRIVSLVETIVKELVDYPEKIKIDATCHDDKLVYIEVKVAQQDVGKVIGKSGKTADALRTIIFCVGSSEKKKVVLQIEQ